MLLIPVVPKGWESPLHIRASRPCWGDSLAVAAHAATEWERLRTPCLHKAWRIQEHFIVREPAGNTPPTMLWTAGGPGRRQEGQEW